VTLNRTSEAPLYTITVGRGRSGRDGANDAPMGKKKKNPGQRALMATRVGERAPYTDRQSKVAHEEKRGGLEPENSCPQTAGQVGELVPRPRPNERRWRGTREIKTGEGLRDQGWWWW
jgi:hypothetical protein